MRSMNRNASLASTFANNHDDDPSPAGGAMPVPAILRGDPANDVREPVLGKLGVVKNTIPVHPALAKYGLTCTEEEVERRSEHLSAGAVPFTVETLNGEIISVVSLLEYAALRKLGRKIETKEIPEPSNLIEYVWGSLPELQRRDDMRAVIAVLAKDDYLALGKVRMSEGGKRGAAARHGKAKRLAEGAKAQDPTEVWFERAGRILNVPPTNIKAVDALRNGKHKTPDMFEALRSGKITRAGDARALAGRWPNSEEHRMGCLDAWITAKTVGTPALNQKPNPSLKVTDFFAIYARSIREGDRTDPLPPVAGEPSDVHVPGEFSLYYGRMEDKGKLVAPESVDIVFADILYDDENREPMARTVAAYADHVNPPGGWAILCAGNFYSRGTLNAFMAGMEDKYEEPIVLYVHYVGAKGNHGGVGCIDGIPYFAFRKRGGKSAHKIGHLCFESQTQHGGEGVDHLWQKNPRTLADIFEALTSPADRNGPPLKVSDPCSGWGTAGVAARRLGYEFVGIEMSNVDRRFEIATAALAEAKPGLWPEPVDPKTAKAEDTRRK